MAPAGVREQIGRLRRLGVTVRLLPHEYARLKGYAQAHGRTLQDMVHTSLAVYLDALDAPWPARRLRPAAPIPEKTGGASLLGIVVDTGPGPAFRAPDSH